MRARVDVGQLATLAGTVGVIERRVDTETTAVAGALAVIARTGSGASSRATAAVALAAAARLEALAQLAALRTVVALAADVYAGVEARVAALVGARPAPPRLRRLLAAAQVDDLEALLVSAPALAAAVAAGATTAAGVVESLIRTLLLPPPVAAREQASILGRLDPRARRLLALTEPGLMTALVGAPASDRFAASRVLVAADLSRLLQRRALVGAQPRLDERIAMRRRLLDEDVVLRHPDGTTTRHRHQLLVFDPAGDGRVVEVVGDLHRARHLAVFVPGTGSDLDRYPGSLQRLVPFAAADPALAVVLWQDADHPDAPFDDPPPPPADLARRGAAQQYLREHVIAAAYRDAADLAGPVLAADIAGLRVALAGPASDLTVLGHSYGGSIVGSAEAHGMVVDRVVHVASAGAYVRDVADYASPSAERFAMTAFDDPVRLAQGHDAADSPTRLRTMLPAALDPLAPAVAGAAVAVAPSPAAVGHGLDPDLLPGVVRLDTGVQVDGRLVRGHSGMFAPGSTAWRNLLAVMTRGRVQVLQPGLWSSHLDPLGVEAHLPTAGPDPVVHVHLPRYVIDRTPYADPGYRAPTLDLGPG